MKQVLVLGAGKSSPYLIHYLLGLADREDWFITVGDVDIDLAREQVGEHRRGSAIHIDVNDATVRSAQIEHADVVVNMLGPQYQDLVAWDCVSKGRHLLSVSYRNQAVRDLDEDARREDVLLLFELGLDPGIDHMSTMSLIRRVCQDGGKIVGFSSYGSGIPAPEQETNPFHYVITWNPRNVVMSSEHGAQYMENGVIKIVPWHHVFHHTWEVDVPGVGMLEAYPNRDSLPYMESFGLSDVRTMIRGTLRYPGWSETWSTIVRLGLPNEHIQIPNLAERTYREVVEMFLPLSISGTKIEARLGRFLDVSPTGRIMQNLKWLGLFSAEKTGCLGDTSAAMLIDLLGKKLRLEPGQRDMVVLVHELDVEYPGASRTPERITSTLVARGEPGGFTAMAKTVGLPTALAVKLLLQGKLSLRGAQIPTHPSIYDPILAELESAGLVFEERVSEVV